MKTTEFKNRGGYAIRFLCILSICMLSISVSAQYQMENLDRGVVAVRTGANNFISWRWLGTEAENITFNLYRNGTKVNATPLTVCNYTDNGAAANASYTVRAIVNGTEQSASAAATPWSQQYLKVGIQAPPSGKTPSGESYTYTANDASIADLDGDGQWEIVLKWDPSNAKDNSQSGYTGSVYLDAYKLNGTRLWRINLGKNIRAGAHYTQFMVYDYNSDGKAEVMCKTADGTIDGKGTVIGSATADYRSSAGYVLTGPEFLTVFNGQTGAAMATVNYAPGRGTVSAWGDGYGNRVDRFRAGVAYLDGKHPSAVFCRGYYTRLVVAAWDWNGSVLSSRWVFDTGFTSSNPYFGQGDHSLSVADVDNDGKQEIISGAAIIDDNGTGYYSTGFGHGDAMHVSDLDPSLPGLEVFNIQERFDKQGAYMYSALTKKVLWTKPSVKAGADGEGPGRGVSADITAAHPGAESWAAGAGVTGLFDAKGNVTGMATPSSCNFLVWWDGDPLRELLNGTTIDKYGTGRMLTANNIVPVSSNNGTKSTPCLSGDFFGDWREEVMWRSSSNDALYIFTTTIPSTRKIRTLMHDPQYRTAIAWQNGAYNQPPHVGFFIGDGMINPPAPNITIVGGTVANAAPATLITSPANNASFTAPGSVTIAANATDSDGTISKVDFYNGATLIGTDATAPYSFNWTNVAAGTYSVTARATDNQGATGTSSAVTVVVKANAAPTVSLTAPSNGSSFGAPASLIITASAADADGTISSVDFYSGSTLLGTDATAPYSFTWNNVPAGSYVLTAKATDNAGAVTTSAAVTVTGRAPVLSTLQAETACAADGVLNETVNAGFTGTGYVNTDNAVGSSISWIIYSPVAQTATLSFRYANASALNRAASVSVGSTVQAANVAFATTGAWTTWNNSSISVNLQAGNNTIAMNALTAEGCANIDALTFTSDMAVNAGGCTAQLRTAASDVLVAPNPSSDVFKLTFAQAAGSVKVTDMNGTIVFTQLDVAAGAVVEFGHTLPVGMYTVVIVYANGTVETKKIQKV